MEMQTSYIVKRFLRAVAAVIILVMVLVHLHAAVYAPVWDVTVYDSATGEKIVGSVLDSHIFGTSVLLCVLLTAFAVAAVWSVLSEKRRFDYILLLISLGLIAVFLVCNHPDNINWLYRGTFNHLVSYLNHDLNDDIMIQEIKSKIILWPMIVSAVISFALVLQNIYERFRKVKEK